MKNGSKISSKNLTNEMFAIQYLVLFNETTKVYYNNSLNFENFKNAMRDKIYRQNKLWQHWWWRFFVKTAKKLKVDVLLKKTIFKNR